MAETQKQEWSKERIQAEMKDLEKARNLRYFFAFTLGGAGFGAIFAAVVMIPFIPPGMPMPGFLIAFIVGGIASLLIAVFVLRSALAKRRQYNDLKRKL
ncbi:hypothetical protein M1N44_03305 [Dehalococcoidia bacterium]|nr:hypothetical protein [Dehalococcoidia bacterium]MCL0070783.1 hypothetical protein [Dehalococcoidia bacterium]